MSLLSSLTNRIFLASALLLVIAMGIVISRVNVSVASQAEADLNAGLAEAAALVNELNHTQFADFLVKGRLIADLPVLKGAAATDDAPTVQPIASEYQLTIGADLFVVTGRGDRPLASAGRLQPADEAIAAILAACRAGRDRTTFWPFEGGVLHAAALPLDAGLSTLVLGISLDRQTAERLKAMTNSEIAFAVGGRLVASTLPADRTAALEASLVADRTFSIWLGGEQFVGRTQTLAQADGPAAPVALVLRSRTQHLAFLNRLHLQIVLTGLAAVVVATLVAYGIARTVTRPLRGLTATMHEIAATGDLARPGPPVGRWDDEDARLLTRTFRQLTGSLDRFRREAAQRERLSSLGRLSTVVAHEIRNPLMIIKSAVRTLHRHPSGDVVEVATSIDEEVARLNRVVTDVLDFARPITFAMAPADLAEVCRDAAQAAQASAEDVPIAVAPSRPALVVTDADRLRTVLVNVLGNAQQAVRARGSARTSASAVRLQTTRGDNGHWHIEVADEGAGIASEDLPRIFDPFFTTRRGGSGLGLALARNIIEGLGGTITVDSRVDAGTTVRIDLPDRTPASEALR